MFINIHLLTSCYDSTSHHLVDSNWLQSIYGYIVFDMMPTWGNRMVGGGRVELGGEVEGTRGSGRW